MSYGNKNAAIMPSPVINITEEASGSSFDCRFQTHPFPLLLMELRMRTIYFSQNSHTVTTNRMVIFPQEAQDNNKAIPATPLEQNVSDLVRLKHKS